MERHVQHDHTILLLSLGVIASPSRFKGVAGTHSIVSVTIEELAGRTFPTTIRKGKGEQLVAGKGLEYIMYLMPVDRCRDLFELAEAGEIDEGNEEEGEESYEEYHM